MKSKEYWERRAAERMVNYQADAERTANEIGKAYYQSQEYIKSEIDKVFRGFQKGFSLSEEEALDILDPSSNKTAMTVLRDAAMKIADPAEREKALAALSSPAYQYRINRLDAINSNIAATCNSLYRTELKADSSFLSSEIVKAYQNTIFDVQKGTGVSGAFDIIPQSKIDAIMSRNWSGTHYSDRIWNNTNKLAGELKSDLMAGFLTGKSEQQMSAEIAERYQTSFFNARRLVRTECTYVTGQAELHSYTEMGVEEYEFSAVLDKYTSKICAELDGKKFKVSQAKPGTNYPPMHPFCRSVANAVLPSEEELDDMWGDTADAIGADVDFDEWVKNLEKTPDGKWKYQKPLDKSEESGIIEVRKDVNTTGIGMYRKRDPGKITPMPNKQFQRIKRCFKARGGVIQQNDETDAYLIKNHCEGITYNENTMLLMQKPSRASVFEELIHTAQYRDGKNDGTPKSRILCEIEAQKKLIKNAKAYKLTKREIEQTERALVSYERDLEELMKRGGG